MKLNFWQLNCKIFSLLLVQYMQQHYYSSTCRRACSSRVCLDTDRAQTVSQRVLSSCIWTLTQEESSRLPSISSLAERFRAWTLLVLFPSSFWKTQMPSNIFEMFISVRHTYVKNKKKLLVLKRNENTDLFLSRVTPSR